MIELIALLAGVLYGLIIGIIPTAGATVGLVALFPFIGYFGLEPYSGVIFCVAVVAASTTGDTFTSVLLGIPGANSASATMVDGFPLARQGKATYALAAAFTSSTMNGLFWGGLTFLLMPWYSKLILLMGVPELWALTILAFAAVGFLSTNNWFRSVLAIVFGIWLGLIGMDVNGDPRFTFGWDYLMDGIQVLPVVAGLFAIPELITGLRRGGATATRRGIEDHTQQTWDGIKITFKEWKLSLRGGAIGSFVGILPGLGGAVSDWLSYSHAVASNPDEKFGDGNIKGVIGCEGSNNAQKASSFIPTILFGIPGAPFAAVLMSLFIYLGFEMGTVDLIEDQRFFNSLSYAFLWGTAITGLICFVFVKYITYLAYIPYKIYFPLLLLLISWSSFQYTGTWNDLAILAIFSGVGLSLRYIKVSRPAVLIGYLLSDRIYNLSYQMDSLYTLSNVMIRPGFILIMGLTGLVFYFSWRNKNKIEYT